MALAPYPPPSIKKEIVPEEWALCLDSWLFLTHRLLVLPSKGFTTVIQDHAVIPFLVSYMKNATANNDRVSSNTAFSSLRKQCLFLTHRVLSDVRPVPDQLQGYSFLATLCTTYSKSRTLSALLERVWSECHFDENISVFKSKATLTELLETSGFDSHFDVEASKAVALARACYHYAQFLMVGSDLVDALCTAFNRQLSVIALKKLTVLAYVCLTSLMKPEKPQTSSLLDHLYTLRSTLISKMLVESTPFLRKLEEHVSGKDIDAKRARPLLESYRLYKSSTNDKRKQPIRRKIDKGKDKASTPLHVHKMSLVSQIQDLFPNLGSAFITKLLDEYSDDTEQVTAHLLDENLPPHLQDADKTESLPENSLPADYTSHDLVPDLAPHTTPPLLPTRHNIHDNDDFDRLAVDASQQHLGSKNADLTADKLLANPKPSNQKAAILSALAAFDSDDDERDDTYDVADVGGTVDTTFADSDADIKHDQSDEALFAAYKTDPNAFRRDAETRRSKHRLALKRDTGMTDEAIEGWAIMMSRDPKRLQRLERTHEMAG
ncbi:MAG: hypothetical protein Q9164_004385, partial [Protoblastenia rupestris]